VAFPGNNRQTKVVEYRAEVLALNRRRVPAGALMPIRYPLAGVILCVVCIVFSVSITIAAECQQRDNFGDWLEHFKQEATSQGISQQTIVSALNGITYDPAIITRDHSQNVFQQSFEQFSGRMVSCLMQFAVAHQASALFQVRSGRVFERPIGQEWTRPRLDPLPLSVADNASVVQAVSLYDHQSRGRSVFDRKD
jgi:ABC-type uncharacterized transport system fused permease/ATPase subunit